MPFRQRHLGIAIVVPTLIKNNLYNNINDLIKLEVLNRVILEYIEVSTG
jgi:hypothetical protein